MRLLNFNELFQSRFISINVNDNYQNDDQISSKQIFDLEFLLILDLFLIYFQRTIKLYLIGIAFNIPKLNLKKLLRNSTFTAYLNSKKIYLCITFILQKDFMNQSPPRSTQDIATRSLQRGKNKESNKDNNSKNKKKSRQEIQNNLQFKRIFTCSDRLNEIINGIKKQHLGQEFQLQCARVIMKTLALQAQQNHLLKGLKFNMNKNQLNDHIKELKKQFKQKINLKTENVQENKFPLSILKNYFKKINFQTLQQFVMPTQHQTLDGEIDLLIKDLLPYSRRNQIVKCFSQNCDQNQKCFWMIQNATNSKIQIKQTDKVRFIFQIKRNIFTTDDKMNKKKSQIINQLQQSSKNQEKKLEQIIQTLLQTFKTKFIENLCQILKNILAANLIQVQDQFKKHYADDYFRQIKYLKMSVLQKQAFYQIKQFQKIPIVMFLILNSRCQKQKFEKHFDVFKTIIKNWTDQFGAVFHVICYEPIQQKLNQGLKTQPNKQKQLEEKINKLARDLQIRDNQLRLEKIQKQQYQQKLKKQLEQKLRTQLEKNQKVNEQKLRKQLEQKFREQIEQNQKANEQKFRKQLEQNRKADEQRWRKQLQQNFKQIQGFKQYMNKIKQKQKSTD